MIYKLVLHNIKIILEISQGLYSYSSAIMAGLDTFQISSAFMKNVVSRKNFMRISTFLIEEISTFFLHFVMET